MRAWSIAIFVAVTIPASAGLRRMTVSRQDIKRTRYDLPLRAAAAARPAPS